MTKVACLKKLKTRIPLIQKNKPIPKDVNIFIVPLTSTRYSRFATNNALNGQNKLEKDSNLAMSVTCSITSKITDKIMNGILNFPREDITCPIPFESFVMASNLYVNILADRL